MSRLKKQFDIIVDLAGNFEKEKIEYHFDGSTAVILQGNGKYMDDIDIVFPHFEIQRVRELFIDEKLSDLRVEKEYSLEHFHFYIEGEKIHLMFYREAVDSFYKNHMQVKVQEREVWVKGLEHFSE